MTTPSDDIVPCTSDEQLDLSAPLAFVTFEGVIAVLSDAGGVESFVVDDAATATWAAGGINLIVATPGFQPTPPVSLDLASGDVVPLSDFGAVASPDVRADGTIVFVRETEADTDIWIARSDGTDQQRLVSTEGIDREPRWSPDGRQVVFSTLGGPGGQDIQIVNADGTQLRTLAATKDYEYAPSFDSDAGSVYFSRNGRLVRIELATNAETVLTDGRADTNPTLSPDGSQLTFVRDGSIYVAQADGSNPRCLQTGLGVGSGPRYRPHR